VKVGWASSILLRVFGWVLAVPMAISTFVLFVGLFGPDRSVSTFVIDLFFFLLFAGMIHLGQTKKLRLRRAKKYIEQAGNNHYINISDLASFNSKPEAYILRDVKKMISEGIYPEGHLDAQENCLMLDNKIYGEYLKLEKEREALEKETGASAARASSSGSAAAASGQAKPDTKLEAMIAEGQECIRKLRDMNDNIPGEEISAKLFRLENLLKEIFEALREHPEQVSQMQKFMNYYLPTTLKLVGAYEDFDNMSTQGEEILEAKREIEKTLDTINSAFSELLGRMVRDTAYDVTTDAQVLQTMLAKEGLTGQDAFEKVPVLRQ
jgi:hypothetical protein